jgi:hypothetical protein
VRRVSSRRPTVALLELAREREPGLLAREREPGLLVFGPDLRSISRWRFRRVAQRVRDEIGCLVWIAPDG